MVQYTLINPAATFSSFVSVSKMEEDEAEPAVPSEAEGGGVWNPQTTPPLAAKTEEKVRGNVFKVSQCMGGACLRYYWARNYYLSWVA